MGIDLDNKKGLDEFIVQCFPDVKTLEELSQKTMVEQHYDNKDKAHVYFIVEKPLTNRGSINGNSKRDLPIIEVKSEGKSLVVRSPSIHKDGCRYEILGTKTLVVLDKNQSEQLQDNLNQICKRYWETSNNKNGLIPIAKLFQDDYVATEGSRHPNLLRVMDSLIKKNNLPLEQIREMGYVWNRNHCHPPLDDKEVEKQWRCASKYIEGNSGISNSVSKTENRQLILSLQM